MGVKCLLCPQCKRLVRTDWNFCDERKAVTCECGLVITFLADGTAEGTMEIEDEKDR